MKVGEDFESIWYMRIYRLDQSCGQTDIHRALVEKQTKVKEENLKSI